MRFYEHVGTAYGGWPEWFPPTDDNDDNDNNDVNDDGGNDDNDTGGSGTGPGEPGDPIIEPDPNRRILHGIEFEQQFMYDMPNLIPPKIHYIDLEVLHFERGIYRITMHLADTTLDPRAQFPFFFWHSSGGRFVNLIDDQPEYAEFVFMANPGTFEQDVRIVIGIGDGLGQVYRGVVQMCFN